MKTKGRIITLSITTGVFFLSTILSILAFVGTNDKVHTLEEKYETMTDLANLVIDAYANAVDYTLCNIDSVMGNTKFSRCENYLARFADETQILREDFGMETHYEYIGK